MSLIKKKKKKLANMIFVNINLLIEPGNSG